MIDRCIRLVIKKPKAILLFFLFVTLILASGLGRLTLESDFEKFLPSDHPAKVLNDSVRHIFGTGKPIFIVVENSGSSGIFNEKTLQIVRDITDAVKSTHGVIGSSVLSLATERYITASDDGMTADYFMETVPSSVSDIARLKENIMSYEILHGMIISEDGKMASIIFEVKNDIDNARIDAEMQRFANEFGDEENHIYYAGDPIASVLVGKYIDLDMKVMMPIAAIIVLIILWISLRCMKAIWLPFVVVSLSVIWAFGLHGLLGVPLNIMSPIMPVILLAIGNTDGIHIISEYYRRRRDASVDEATDYSLLKALRNIYTPVVLTSITSALGFLTLLASPIKQLGHFGIFTAFGIIAAMIMSLAVVPAMIVLINLEHPMLLNTHKKTAPFVPAVLLARWGKIACEKQKTIGVALLVLILLSTAGIYRLKVDDVLIENFKKSTPIYKSDKLINQHFDGTSIMNIVLTPKNTNEGEDFFQRPESLRMIEDIQNWSESNNSSVGDTLSIVDFLKRIRFAMNGNNPSFEAIPSSANETAQYLLLYGLSAKPEDFEKYATIDYSKVNLYVYLKTPSYRDSNKYMDGLTEHIKQAGYSNDLKIEFAGQNTLDVTRVSLIVDTLKTSLIYSAIGVFFLCSIAFRSILAGLLNLSIVSIAIMINFAVMGALGINVAVGTSLISSMIIGIGVDFSIHLISKYKIVLKTEKCWKKSTEIVLGSIGETLFISAAAIIAGFMVLLFSQVPPTIIIGALVALSMFSSFVASVMFSPMLIVLIKPSFLFKSDLLTPSSESGA